jgi:hypothetical protein
LGGLFISHKSKLAVGGRFCSFRGRQTRPLQPPGASVACNALLNSTSHWRLTDSSLHLSHEHRTRLLHAGDSSELSVLRLTRRVHVCRATLVVSVACSVPVAHAATLDRRVYRNVTPASIARSVLVARASSMRQTLTSASVALSFSVCRLFEGRNDFRFKRFLNGFDSNLLNYKKNILANTLVQFGCVDHQTPKSKVNGPRVYFPYNLPLFGD